jgi:RND superfamily putative drug exporter
MHLVGPAMWLMPAWLERRLPHLHIERPETDEANAPERERVLA